MPIKRKSCGRVHGKKWNQYIFTFTRGKSTDILSLGGRIMLKTVGVIKKLLGPEPSFLLRGSWLLWGPADPSETQEVRVPRDAKKDLCYVEPVGECSSIKILSLPLHQYKTSHRQMLHIFEIIYLTFTTFTVKIVSKCPMYNYIYHQGIEYIGWLVGSRAVWLIDSK